MSKQRLWIPLVIQKSWFVLRIFMFFFKFWVISKTERVKHSQTLYFSSKRSIVTASIIATQTIPLKERLNHKRKGFNAFLGFIKIGQRHPIGLNSGPDRYRRMKFIASIFALSGVFYGSLSMLFGYYFGTLLQENQSYVKESNAELEVCVADTGKILCHGRL